MEKMNQVAYRYVLSTMATKCILIKNMFPDTRDNNEYLLSYILSSHNIRFKKVTCPTDKNGHNSSHAFIEFDSDYEIAWTAQYLDGYSLWYDTGEARVLRAKIRPSQNMAQEDAEKRLSSVEQRRSFDIRIREAHAERSWWDEEQAWKEAHAERSWWDEEQAWKEAHAERSWWDEEQAWKEAHAERSWWDEEQAWKEAHAEARTPPHIYEMSSHPSSAISAASRTPTVIMETYCIYCNNTTHSTKNCRKLHYQWSKHNYICKHCVNIPGCKNLTHPISYKNVIVCPRLIREGMTVLQG